MPLNRAQRDAVNLGAGPAMILAGPGSGKTTVITHRIRRLIQKHGVNPSEILVITFTRAAAKEMQERFLRLVEGEYLPVTFGTFHAVFFKVLKHAYGYTAKDILPPDKKMEFLREAFTEAKLEIEDENEFLVSVMNEISEVKGDGISLEHYYSKNCPEEVFGQLYKGYEQRLRRARLVDFDDMLGLCYELFLQRPDILQAWQQKYHYILVDEFQDINRLQYEVVRLLAAPENNLFIVGDDDQSIYRFRGARPEIMLGFPKDYPDCRQILLDVNYRCIPDIVEPANRLIEQNDVRFRKALRSSKPQGPPPVLREFANMTDENDQLLAELQRYHRLGIPYEEMAVLYRTNSNPRALVEQLMRMNLPFTMRDVVPNLYDHWIAGDLITYMLVAAGSRKRSDYLRIINRPKRYVQRACFTESEVDLKAIYTAYEDKEWVTDRLARLEYDLKMLRKMAPYAAVNYIRRGIGYEDFLKEYAEYRRMKPDELMEVLDELQESAGHFQTLTEWLTHIQEYSQELQSQKQERSKGGGILISTIHSVKGLEYQAVFIPDANEGILPHKRAVLPAEIEEERRLFYVALTRAKTYLHIYWTRERYNKRLPVSRFVTETGAAGATDADARAKPFRSEASNLF